MLVTNVSKHVSKRIEQACKKAGHKGCYVSYRMGRTLDEEVIDNLDEVAVLGSCVLKSSEDSLWKKNKGKPYESEELCNPTWLDVIVCANKMIITTKDYTNIYLDALYIPTKYLPFPIPIDVDVREFGMLAN